MPDSFTYKVGLELDVVKVANLEKLTTAVGARLEEAMKKVEEYNEIEARRKTYVSDAKANSGSGSSGNGESPKDKLTPKAMESIAKGTQTIATGGMGILKNTFGILSDVFERIKAASPLLQAVESLFNLAMQLFFMPLGTKLATVLIPSIVELVDNVMQIWDGFEDKSLGEILSDTIKLGAEIFGQFFQDIGKELAKEGGILGTIGQALEMLGNFIENSGEWMIEKVTSILQFIIKYLPQILGAIVAFKTMSYLMQAALILTTSSITPWSAAIGAAAIAGVGAAAGTIAANVLTMAEGGYVPATPGGVPALIAEGGEGESVVPDSKKLDFAKSVLGGGAGNTFNIYVNGYTDTDLENKIVRVINEQTNLSRLRSGF